MKSVDETVAENAGEVISTPVSVRRSLKSELSSDGSVNNTRGPASPPVHSALSVYPAIEQPRVTATFPSESDAIHVVDPNVMV